MHARIEVAVPASRHLLFLDGVRALAAVYVVLDHVYMTLAYDATITTPLPGLWTYGWLFSHAYEAVLVFIVISGYCLLLPLVKRPMTIIDAAWIKSFCRRRARRLLPAYYGALGLTLLLAWLVPPMGNVRGQFWDTAQPVFGGQALLTHLGLIYGFFPRSFTAIDPPMWSLAVEWNVYVVFCCLLLPVWRRAGSMAAAVAGLGFAYLVHRATGGGLDYLRLNFIFLFALGMVACSMAHQHKHERAMFLGFVALLGLATCWLPYYHPHVWERLTTVCPLVDVWTGVATAECLYQLSTSSSRGWAMLRDQVLASAPLQTLGACSYSLYLVHLPLMTGLYLTLQPYVGASFRWALLLLVLPGVFVLAWLFYRFFEAPYLRQRWRATIHDSVPGPIPVDSLQVAGS